MEAEKMLCLLDKACAGGENATEGLQICAEPVGHVLG
jgi:hypothetical protein